VALFTKAELIRVLLTNESEEARAKLKHGADEPEPHEKDEPKAIAASTEVKSDKAETFAEKYQRLTGKTLEEVPNV
jgi:hypothetical protein